MLQSFRILADISASGREILVHLNEQPNKLIPSDVISRTVNRTKMFPLGKLLVTLCGNQEYLEDVHIYPNVRGTLITWKACKALHILPPYYPQLIPLLIVHMATLSPLHTTFTVPLAAQHITSEYPTLFEWTDQKHAG